MDGGITNEAIVDEGIINEAICECAYHFLMDKILFVKIVHYIII